jgi:hypothetical protein
MRHNQRIPNLKYSGLCPNFSVTMTKRIQIAAALLLLVCMACPFVEIAADSNNSIFATGHDRETTLAVILLLLELAFAVANLLIVFVSRSLEKERLIILHRYLRFAPSSIIPLPETSPPLLL